MINVLNYGTDSDAIDLALADVPITGGVVYFPAATYTLQRPIDIKKGVSLLGDFRLSQLVADTDFNEGNGGYMIRNWSDSDYTLTEKGQPLYSQKAPENIAASADRNYHPFIDGFSIDMSLQQHVCGLGWVHMQESGMIKNIIIANPYDSIGIYITRNSDPEGSLNGGYFRNISLYGTADPDKTYLNQVRICNNDATGEIGSDINISELTTAPVACTESVFYVSGVIDVTFDNIHCEAWVDTASGSDEAIFRLLNVKGFSLTDSFFSNYTTPLAHPLIYSTNSNSAGYGVSSPNVSNLQFYGPFSFGSGVPLIKDHSQSLNIHDIFLNGTTRINYYDGNIYSYGEGGTGASFVKVLSNYSLKIGNSIIRSLTDELKFTSLYLDATHPFEIPYAMVSGNHFAEVRLNGRREIDGLPFYCIIYLAIADNSVGFVQRTGQIIQSINVPGTLSVVFNTSNNFYYLHTSAGTVLNIAGTLIINGPSFNGI